MRLRKKYVMVMLALGFVGAIFLNAALQATVHRKSAGAPTGRTGAPNEQTCGMAGCHDDYALNSGNGSLQIELKNGGNSYQPGQQHEFKITVIEDSIDKFGFQMTALADKDTSKTGELQIVNGLRTQKISPQDTTAPYYGRTYITHTIDGNKAVAMDTNRWLVRWIAPSDTVSDVTFYVASVAANGNNVETNDHVYTTTLTLQRDTNSSVYATSNLAKICKIYPNPVENVLKLKIRQQKDSYGPYKLQLYNLQGKQVLDASFSSADYSVHRPEGLKGGLYLYRLLNSEKHPVKTGRLVLK